MSDPRYPDIHVQLSGEDGNALAIIGNVSKALKRAGVDREEVDAFRAQAMSGDYDNVLRTALEWVEVS